MPKFKGKSYPETIVGYDKYAEAVKEELDKQRSLAKGRATMPGKTKTQAQAQAESKKSTSRSRGRI
jgi:hypothetical protein